MAHLVHEGEGVVERVRVVEQHEGMRAERAGGIGARALALVFIDVDPTVPEALLEDLQIPFAERSERLAGLILRLLKGHGDLLALHHGGIDIIIVELVRTEETLAQADIAVHSRQVSVHGVDEVVVDLHRHLGFVERGVQGGFIVTGVRKELQLLHLRAQHRGGGVAELAVCAVERAERRLAQRAVLRLHVGDVGAVRERVRLALAVHRVREREIGVVEHGEDVVRRLGKLAGGGEQRFALRGKRVGLLAALARDDQAVMLERGLLAEEGVDRFIRDGEQLRRLEGEGLAHVHQEILRLGAHGLVIGVAGVLVRAAERIVDEFVAGRVDGVDRAQEAEQAGGAFAKASFVGSGVRHKAAHRLQLFIPRLVGGVHIGDGPSELRIDLAAGRNGFCHDTSLLFIIKIAVPGRQGRAHAPSAAGGGCTAVVL